MGIFLGGWWCSVLIRMNELSELTVSLAGKERRRNELGVQTSAMHLHGLYSKTQNFIKSCWAFNIMTEAEKINN